MMKKIQSILENELYNNVSDDSDTSISYTHGNFNDESFEDVFSNINGDKKEKSSNEIASIASEIFLNNLMEENNSPKKEKVKKEYFQNYMTVCLITFFYFLINIIKCLILILRIQLCSKLNNLLL